MATRSRRVAEAYSQNIEVPRSENECRHVFRSATHDTLQSILSELQAIDGTKTANTEERTMARPGLRINVKFKRAQRMLNIPAPHLHGHLETLWEVCYEDGNPVIGDAAAVEAAAEWVGDDDALFKALLNCGGKGRAGFIELVEGHDDCYQIHQLAENSPEYVRARRRAAEQRKRKRQASEASDNGKPVQIDSDECVPIRSSTLLTSPNTHTQHPYLIKLIRAQRPPRRPPQTYRRYNAEPMNCLTEWTSRATGRTETPNWSGRRRHSSSGANYPRASRSTRLAAHRTTPSRISASVSTGRSKPTAAT